MAAFETHVKHEIKGITSPPFRFPPRTPTPPSITTSILETPETTTSLPPEPSIASTTTEVPPSTTYFDTTPDDAIQSVIDKARANDFYQENFTTLEELNKTYNATLSEEGIKELQTEENPATNATTVFDWVRPPGADADNILRMSNQDAGYKAPPDYTLYIILGSILFVLIVLTIVTIMLYKAYKSRDQYSLTSGNRVKVFKAFDEAGATQEDKLDYEIVDFDKNSYRF